MHRWVISLMLAMLLIPAICRGEFYKYRDASGVLRFTDNLADVPANQREQVKEYKEVVSPEPTQAPAVQMAAPSLNERAARLNEERELLNQEYAALEKEREALEQATREPSGDDEYEAYKRRVDAFNDRIKAYEEKRQQFQAKVDAFNEDAKNQ